MQSLNNDLSKSMLSMWKQKCWLLAKSTRVRDREKERERELNRNRDDTITDEDKVNNFFQEKNGI